MRFDGEKIRASVMQYIDDLDDEHFIELWNTYCERDGVDMMIYSNEVSSYDLMFKSPANLLQWIWKYCMDSIPSLEKNYIMKDEDGRIIDFNSVDELEYRMLSPMFEWVMNQSVEEIARLMGRDDDLHTWYAQCPICGDYLDNECLDFNFYRDGIKSVCRHCANQIFYAVNEENLKKIGGKK